MKGDAKPNNIYIGIDRMIDNVIKRIKHQKQLLLIK